MCQRADPPTGDSQPVCPGVARECRMDKDYRGGKVSAARLTTSAHRPHEHFHTTPHPLPSPPALSVVAAQGLVRRRTVRGLPRLCREPHTSQGPFLRPSGPCVHGGRAAIRHFGGGGEAGESCRRLEYKTVQTAQHQNLAGLDLLSKLALIFHVTSSQGSRRTKRWRWRGRPMRGVGHHPRQGPRARNVGSADPRRIPLEHLREE